MSFPRSIKPCVYVYRGTEEVIVLSSPLIPLYAHPAFRNTLYVSLVLTYSSPIWGIGCDTALQDCEYSISGTSPHAPARASPKPIRRQRPEAGFKQLVTTLRTFSRIPPRTTEQLSCQVRPALTECYWGLGGMRSEANRRS
jgi:hypothetical protein